MKKMMIIGFSCIVLSAYAMCQEKPSREFTTAKVFQTSKAGDKLALKESLRFSTSQGEKIPAINLSPEVTYQQVVGFGGAFTQSSAHVLSQLSPKKRLEILDSYFRSDKAAYTLMRTHINSCDFSTKNYAYDNTPGDVELKDFSISEDLSGLVPLIKDAMKCDGAEFKILASPWTAPPWMKDNNAWNNGSLLPRYYPTWALYFSKYIREYSKQGINIWAVTVENEPENNSGQWESMLFTPATTADFVKNHLAPQFKRDGLDAKILIFDHNRDRVKAWADGILSDTKAAESVWGTAVHWYSSSVEWFPDTLNYVHDKYPTKHLLHTEACIDTEVPRWQDDRWYWEKEAKDWGFTWAPPADKPLHPPYVPVYRYARDIIGGLNSWLEGWIDWNIVLDAKGGPNHVNNWCIAPVIAKPETDEAYYTPLYYVMAHFSKFFRPGATRIGVATELKNLMITSCENADGTIAVAILNDREETVHYRIIVGGREVATKIVGNSLQTIVIE